MIRRLSEIQAEMRINLARRFKAAGLRPISVIWDMGNAVITFPPRTHHRDIAKMFPDVDKWKYAARILEHRQYEPVPVWIDRSFLIGPRPGLE